MKKFLEITTEIDQLLANVFDVALKTQGFPMHYKIAAIMKEIKEVPDPVGEEKKTGNVELSK